MNDAPSTISAADRVRGSSFYAAMRIMPRIQREAMYEIYAFCRNVDDVADGGEPAALRRAELARWRQDVMALYNGHAPARLAGLTVPIAQFGLQRDDFLAIIEADEKLFHAVRKRGGLFAQPLVNFVVHRKGLAIRSLAQTLPGASDESFYKPVSAGFDRTVEVWVNLANSSGLLRAGGAAEVVVATKQTSEAVVVPASAVTLDAPDKNTGTVVVVDAGNVAHVRRVTIGIRAPQIVQVTAGLQGGETVVTEGNYALPDGSKVEINTASPE